MYTEEAVRNRLTAGGYSENDIEVILNQFRNAGFDYGMFDFDGQNCNDYLDDDVCTGWDGVDHRCNCGNRRVYWTVEGNYAYGIAY